MPLEGEELADYLTWNHSALVIELSEAMQEVGWKLWAKPRGWLNRKAFIEEMVDAQHFAANMLAAVGVTDDEWDHAYRAKQLINAARQANGYAGRAPL